MLLFSVTIKDCTVQTFRSGGKGGQNVNKVESGVRIIHNASGAVGQSTDTRDQLRNKRLAFERMANSKKFLEWQRVEISKRLGNFAQDNLPSTGRVRTYNFKDNRVVDDRANEKSYDLKEVLEGNF